MVSPLTDRLLSGYSSSETNSSNGRPSRPPQAGPTTDSGGYSADYEVSAQGTPPPFCIDLLSRHHKRHASGGPHGKAPDEKKKKLEHEKELSYLAHVARHEVARGGRKCPKINAKKPRILPESIDMSKVSLVSSKNFFMPPRKPVEASAWNVTLTMSPDLCIEALQSIVKSCSAHYHGSVSPSAAATSLERDVFKAPLPSPPPTPPTEMEGDDSSDVASTTSSVTEDGDPSSGEDNAQTISMGDALTLSKQPRIIVIADPPYTLVHCNAAFLEMTGVASSKVLGRPLVDALDEQTLDVGEDFWTLHHEQLHLRCSSSMVASGTPNVTCRARLSPIGAQLESVTHISIELDPPGEVKEAWNALDRPIFMPPTAEEPPVKVVA